MKKLAAVAALAAAIVPACTSEDDDAGVVAATVEVLGTNEFSPKTVTIRAGEVVRWVWLDGVHNVASGASCTHDGAFRSGEPVTGATYERKFATAGTFTYFCEPHCQSDAMVGTVIVE